MMRWRVTRGRSPTGGYSLVETLVVLAIIGILLSLQANALLKALRMAKSTAAGEAMRQESIARESDGDRIGDLRGTARHRYRKKVDYGKGEAFVSELIFVVRNDEEFIAYWHTLLNPANTAPVETVEGDALRARTPKGNEYILPRVGGAPRDGRGPYAVAWEYISTDLSDTSFGSLGGNVQFNDGHLEYVRYPGKFPMTEVVAIVSHQYVEDFE